MRELVLPTNGVIDARVFRSAEMITLEVRAEELSLGPSGARFRLVRVMARAGWVDYRLDHVV
jgi:hypothetical protein